MPALRTYRAWGVMLAWVVAGLVIVVWWAWNGGHLEWLPGWAQVVLAWGGILLAVVLVWQLGTGDDCVPTNTNLC